MAACTAGELPFRVIGEGRTFDGASPTAACQGVVSWLDANGYAPSAVVAASTAACSVTYSGGTPYSYSIIQPCEDAGSSSNTPQSTINCGAACTVTVVHELSLPPLQLGVADGGQIALAIGAIWAIGWAVRMVIQVFKTGDGNSTSEG